MSRVLGIPYRQGFVKKTATLAVRLYMPGAKPNGGSRLRRKLNAISAEFKDKKRVVGGRLDCPWHDVGTDY